MANIQKNVGLYNLRANQIQAGHLQSSETKGCPETIAAEKRIQIYTFKNHYK